MRTSYVNAICAVVIAIATIMGVSCDKRGSNVAFPKLQTITCDAGDKPSFSFTAETSWKISSDALWCKFITPAGEMYDTAGGAGTITVTLKISDTNIENQTTRANITLWMGGEHRTIAVVERGKKELFVKLLNSEGKKSETLALGYDDYITTTINANFRYAAINIPSWVEVAKRDEKGNVTITNSIAGSAGEDVEVLLRIVKDGKREATRINAEDGNLISFVDEEHSISFDFPIIYDGMGDRSLTFRGPTQNYYGWEVSNDGKTFRYYNEAEESYSTFDNELQYSITAQDNDYAVLLLEQHIERGIPVFECFTEQDSRWIEFNKESTTLRVNEYNGRRPRYGAVMALPRGIYNDIQGDINLLFEDDISSGITLPAIATDYSKYLLIDFVQHDFAEAGEYEGMYAYHSLTSLDIYCEPHYDAELTAKYGTEDIYICDFVNPVEGKTPGVIVNPLIEGWDTAGHEAGNAGVEVWHGDTQLKISKNEYYIGENIDEELSVHLWGPSDGWKGENMVVVFKVSNVVKKILVVTPPAL